ncbi:MAG: hypothetical protein AB7I01_14125 [Gammaproteobacteria bacterium]
MPAIRLQVDREPGSKLGKEQRRFNKLVKNLTALRARLAEWQAFLSVFQQRVATDLEPVEASFRAARLELIMSLHDAATNAALSKRDRAKVVEILLWHLNELLSEAPDDTLIALHDQYSTVSFAEKQAADEAHARGLAQNLFGLEPNEQDAGLSVDELLRRIAEQSEFDDSADTSWDEDAGHAGPNGKTRRGESLGVRLAQGASQAVRQIYRKLASELHPDREADATARARKTELMQEANRAYADEDLIKLLDLQLQVEQTTSDALSGMPRERLREFNYLLERQCVALEQELLVATGPFAMDSVAGEVSPDAVMRSLKRDVRDLKRRRDECAAEAANIRDPRYLKMVLKDYHLGDLEREDDLFLDDLLGDLPPPKRRRR